MLLGLIAARAMAVGFELPAYSDAATFFQPIEATVDQTCTAHASACTDAQMTFPTGSAVACICL